MADVNAPMMLARAFTRAHGDHSELKEFRPEHTGEVANFLSTQFARPAESWSEGIERIYWKNPNISANDCPGWVLYSEGRLVGFQGNIPHPFHVSGSTVSAAAANSWCVSPDVRRRGYAFLLAGAFLEQKRADVLFFTTAGETAAKLYLRSGAIRVPTDRYDEVLFWIVDTPRFLRGTLEYTTGSRLLATIASAAVSVTTILSSNGCTEMHVAAHNDAADEISRTAAELDRFWHEWCPGFITGVRTPEQLAWRLAGQRKYWLSVRDDHGDLLGYAAARPYRDGNLKRLRILDVWVNPRQLQVIQTLIRRAKELASQVGCSCVEVCGLNEKYRQVLELLRPYRRRMSKWPYYVLTRDRSLREMLLRSELWHPTEYDGDTPFSITSL